MKAIIQPLKKNFRVLYIDTYHIRTIGVLDLTETPKGIRPVKYRIRFSRSSGFKNLPTRDLITHLRRAQVYLTSKNEQFESFLKDLQIQYAYVSLCRFCLMDDRLTELDKKNTVFFGEGEEICMDCARKELRRELVHMGKLGRSALSHLDELLIKYRNIDRVLATIEPDRLSVGQTLYDRLEAHKVDETCHIEELPVPFEFVSTCGVKTLMPVQQLAVEAGLLYGKDLLVVSATASGKTFIGEMAGLKNLLENRGRMLFLVPLVALAYQKYERFSQKYGKLAEVSIITGLSRVKVKENRRPANRNRDAGIIVATYEGIDHLMRTGATLSGIGTVIIDEVQMLEDKERGHRVDGLISRLKYTSPKAQFLYLSATIGHPKSLAEKLDSKLVSYNERPVSLERYLIFPEREQKIPTEKTLVTEEYNCVSSKGYHGKTIIFTNSRARCHLIAEKIGDGVSPYHAGLTQQDRRIVEERFEKGQLRAVVTTAALAAGVDFPASQVIFDSLAMGIEWLTVQEFQQMSGRAGRPDYHDLGKVVILAEPGSRYVRESNMTEDEVAMCLLKGEMGEVAPEYSLEQSSEIYVANAVVCRGNITAINRIDESLVGRTEPVEALLLEKNLIVLQDKTIYLNPLARVMAEHFIGIERLLRIMRLVHEMKDPIEILADLECASDEEATLVESRRKTVNGDGTVKDKKKRRGNKHNKR
jgi:archaea-specific helicase